MRVQRGAGFHALRAPRFWNRLQTSRSGAVRRDPGAVWSDSFRDMDALAAVQPAVVVFNVSPATRIFVALELGGFAPELNGRQTVQNVLQ